MRKFDWPITPKKENYKGSILKYRVPLLWHTYMSRSWELFALTPSPLPPIFF